MSCGAKSECVITRAACLLGWLVWQTTQILSPQIGLLHKPKLFLCQKFRRKESHILLIYFSHSCALCLQSSPNLFLLWSDCQSSPILQLSCLATSPITVLLRLDCAPVASNHFTILLFNALTCFSLCMSVDVHECHLETFAWLCSFIQILCTLNVSARGKCHI